MITAAELAKGRALRDAERGETWQSRTTHALSDWLDRHCDGLLEAAEALAEKDAQIAALREWLEDAIERAAQQVQEALERDDQEKGMAALGALGAMELVARRLRETPAPPQQPHFWTPNDAKDKCIVCGDGVWGRHRFQVQPETPAPPQETQDPRYKHILSGDYYMPGKKEGG